jgi:tRNA-specific 2-thiouridylase
MELKADYVSTGHYAKSELDEGTKRYLLKKGIDRRKDQSYVLFSLRQDQLRYVLFPLGGYRKEEVRKRAFQIGLRVHDKPESQEICFVQDASYRTFLSERLEKPIQPGPIIDRMGNILGRHRGIPFYTIGQRRGLVGQGYASLCRRIDLERVIVVKEVYADASQ